MLKRVWTMATMSQFDRSLLLRAFWVVVAVRVGLAVLPFASVERLFRRLARVTATRTPRHELVPSIVSAVTVAANHVPGSSCLTRALATRSLLARYRVPAHLCIGFGRGQGGVMRGHAWLEREGIVVMGDGELGGSASLRLPPDGTA